MKNGILPVLLLLGLSLCSAAIAQEVTQYAVHYEIQDSLEVRETLTITFPQPLQNETRRYLRLGEVTGLRLTNGTSPLSFQTASDVGTSLVSVTVPPGSRQLEASFTTRESVFSRGDGYLFFTRLTTPAGTEELRLSATLPSQASFDRGRVLPANVTVDFDGQRATLRWALVRPSNETTISVAFSRAAAPFPWLPLLGASLAVSSIVLFLLYLRQRMVEETLRGFSEDERKVIQFLKARQEIYQEEINEALGFSMAKVSRMVKRLEASGLVEKRKIGRSNKLYWKKP